MLDAHNGLVKQFNLDLIAHRQAIARQLHLAYAQLECEASLGVEADVKPIIGPDGFIDASVHVKHDSPTYR